jgi:hypothetical protein
MKPCMTRIWGTQKPLISAVWTVASSNGFSMLWIFKSGTIEAQQNFQKDNPRNVIQSFLITNEPNRYSDIRFDVQPPAWFKSGDTKHLRFRMPENGEKWLTARSVQFAR